MTSSNYKKATNRIFIGNFWPLEFFVLREFVLAPELINKSGGPSVQWKEIKNKRMWTKSSHLMTIFVWISRMNRRKLFNSF
jgi:hypothetical protein